jgi:hypothetical protein
MNQVAFPSPPAANSLPADPKVLVMRNPVHLQPSKPIPGKPHRANDTPENFFSLFPSLGKRVFWGYSDLFFFARVGRGTRRRCFMGRAFRFVSTLFLLLAAAFFRRLWGKNPRTNRSCRKWKPWPEPRPGLLPKPRLKRKPSLWHKLKLPPRPKPGAFGRAFPF